MIQAFYSNLYCVVSYPLANFSDGAEYYCVVCMFCFWIIGVFWVLGIFYSSSKLFLLLLTFAPLDQAATLQLIAINISFFNILSFEQTFIIPIFLHHYKCTKIVTLNVGLYLYTFFTHKNRLFSSEYNVELIYVCFWTLELILTFSILFFIYLYSPQFTLKICWEVTVIIDCIVIFL